MSEPAALTATFVPKPGEFYGARLELETIIRDSLNESGCLRYEITEESDTHIVVSERWESESHAQQHLHGDAVRRLNERLVPMLAEPPKVAWL